ncbi:tonB-linked outer membrane protein SusC/RagA family [Bacteroides intestinalis CAG:315]|uniref:TonB-dependent receptor n=1 Tax=Bacteroides intestinalis TaxID=329854 RepID=A0A412YLT3_9BACE|nr:TonB-dependent receptor [Bacteroides intestinalis]RGV58332.1 TonB-dependent receptor [Bacteroides intestinalis]RHA63423.1 TonB-dependent receptor [Bacteroides intestinalis]CDD95894.1 tonB-linked outer membrane protein SusC/RagA family [Bacteroides intestinalis CAG:315]
MKKKTLLPLERASWLKSLFLLVCLVLSGTTVFAQEKTVTGVVTDSFNEPLIGASIVVQGTTNGVITDLDGKYSIKVTPGATLQFSYVGMEKQSVKVGNQNVINVQLKDDSQMLAETVVIGYGSAKKRDLTGSITNIKGDEIANKPVANPLSALQGKVAGVQVINSGRAGEDPEIRVRGTNSINGYKPLYVVDGLFNDNINFLNPQDIESMEILKDPSSLAIFGVRGANGVIIITTKKAKVGQTRVNINGSFGFKSVPNQIEMVDAAGFKELYNEQLRNEGNPEFDFTGWNGNTNWQDEIFQTGFITNNNVSITGASEKHSFYLGAGYAYEQGNIKNEKYSKITLSVSNEYKLTDNFRVGFQFNGARILPADTKTVTTAVRATPVATVFNDQYGLYTTLPEFQKAQMNNPMVDVDLKANTTRAENYRGSGNVYAEWDFLKHFQFKAMFSMDYASNNSRKFTPIIQVYDASAEGSIVTLGDGKTGVSQAKQTEMKTQSDYLLTYTNTWGDHSLTATAGFTTYYNKLENLGAARAQGVGLVIPDNPDKWYVSIGDAGTSTNESTQWERATVSMLGRILYNYKGRYLFNGSFRRDGSSAFSYTGNQWQNFYSVGAGWLISEEEFMKDITWLDMLKLKGSWGTLGNQNLDKAYPAEPLLSNAYSAVFGTPSAVYPGYQLSYLPNATLRWEKVEAWEVGAEANFFRNRLHLEGVYYKKTTKDLLAEVPGISGTVPGIGNLGSIENKGIELAINWREQIGDWNYSIGGNLTTIKNKVLSLVQEGYSIISGDKSQSYTMAGFPIGYFYGYKVEGVYQNQAEIDNSPKNTLATVTPGDLKFVDVDGNGEITPADRTMIGDPTPDVTYGINFSVGYKNWELGVDMMGQAGNEIYRTWDNYNWSQFNFMKQRLNRWHGEGTSNSQPLLNMKHTINNLNSEYYIEDGSFFRIRNVQLAYNFDKTLLSRIGVQALKLYANIQNLKTWKHNTGYTPELGGTAIAFGVDNGSYPMPVVYTFGFNLTF